MMSYDVEWYHHLPLPVKEILQTLKSHGRKAFVVGGAVRDLWLGVEPKDFDLVSEATPEEIARWFPKTLDVGKAFGIMVVVTEEGPIEVARFRADGAYTDSRHPDEIHFSNPEEDAKRRDFRLNALFYDPFTEKVLDYVGGVEDLKKKVIQSVGDPSARFQEDALRMLRAVRFHSQLAHLGFTLAPEVLAAIKPLADRLQAVSRERITQEMQRLVTSSKPSAGLQDIITSGLWEPIFGRAVPTDFDPLVLDKAEKIFQENFSFAPSPFLPWAVLAALISGVDWGKQFILGKETKAKLLLLLPMLKNLKNFSALSLGEKKSLVGQEIFPEAWTILCAQGEGGSDFLQIPAWKEMQALAGKLQPKPLLSSSDLLKLGVVAGPIMGKILSEIHRLHMNEEIGSREEAEEIVQRMMKNSVS